MPLFGSAWGRAALDAEQAALREIEGLDEKRLADPDLTELIDRLAKHFSLRVASLERQAKRQMRRKAERGAGVGAVIDIKIPFKGDAISFQLAPADCPALSLPCEVRSDVLFVSLPDDGSAEEEFDRWLEQVSGALDALRAEVAVWEIRLRAVLEKAARERRERLASARPGR